MVTLSSSTKLQAGSLHAVLADSLAGSRTSSSQACSHHSPHVDSSKGSLLCHHQACASRFCLEEQGHAA